MAAGPAAAAGTPPAAGTLGAATPAASAGIAPAPARAAGAGELDTPAFRPVEEAIIAGSCADVSGPAASPLQAATSEHTMTLKVVRTMR
jgi:hypothetical protein